MDNDRKVQLIYRIFFPDLNNDRDGYNNWSICDDGLDFEKIDSLRSLICNDTTSYVYWFVLTHRKNPT